jgi:hypothetical protein
VKTETTYSKKPLQAPMAAIFNPVKFMDRLLQIFNCPKLSCQRMGFISQNLAGRVLMQTNTQIFNLQFSQLGTVSTCPFIHQALNATFLIGSDPFHQAASAAIGNIGERQLEIHIDDN